jgi:triosephosphate isomerase
MKSRNEVEFYAKIIEKNLSVFNSNFIQIYIIVDFLSFEYLKKRPQHLDIDIGVQDLFWEDYGPYAGEVSPLILKDLGCDCAYF